MTISTNENTQNNKMMYAQAVRQVCISSNNNDDKRKSINNVNEMKSH
jgi:hypothetical protein